MSFFKIEGQIIVFHFATSDEISPRHWGDEVKPHLLALSKKGPVGLLPVFGPDVRTIGNEVLAFWLDQMRNPDVRIVAVAAVSDRLALKIAAQAFEQANRLLKRPMGVKTFSDEGSAKLWIEAHVQASA